MHVTVRTLLLLELGHQQTVDEDAAVALIEQIAATLQRLKPNEKERCLQYLRGRATCATTDAEREAIEKMATSLGLVSECVIVLKRAAQT